MIIVRFDYSPKPGTDGNRTIAHYDMDAVPIVGETVNVWGYPFVVTRRSWAVSDGDDVVNDDDLVEGQDEGQLYAHLDLIKAHDYQFVDEHATLNIDPLTKAPYVTNVPEVAAPSWVDPVVVVALLRDLAENEASHYCERDRALIRRGANQLEQRISPNEFGSTHHDAK